MTKRRRQVSSSSSSSSSSSEEEREVPDEAKQQTSVPPTHIKTEWKNRERVLLVCSRGCSFRDRHLMQDLRTLMPHSKKESKVDKNKSMTELNEIAQMRNCSKVLYLESRKKKDLYMWMSNVNGGPSAKFLVHNVHTMGELRMSGNCLRGSRPILSFDSDFETEPHLQIIKQLLIQTLGVPRRHPRSQPFFDHVFTFSLSDGRIWFRNYEILADSTSLQEIGPRLVLQPITLLAGSMNAAVLYRNPQYTSPNYVRRQIKLAAGGKYVQKVEAKKGLKESRQKLPISHKTDDLDDLFDNPLDNVDHVAQEFSRSIDRKNKKRRRVT